MAMAWTSYPRLLVAAVTAAAMSLVLGAAGPAAAQSAPADGQPARPPAITAGASATVVSAFVWRGWVIIDEASVQPLAWVKAGGVTLTSWVNVSPRNEGDAWTEHDLTLDYTRQVGRVLVSAGYVHYFFRSFNTDRWTHECYVGAAVPGPLNPAVRIYQDIHQGSGTYVSAGVSHSVSLGTKGLSITPSAALGYNNHQWVEGSGWSDLNVGVLLALPLGGHVGASASVNYSRSLNDDWFPSKPWGGLTVIVH